MKTIVPITLAAALALSSAVFFWKRRTKT